MTTSSQASSQHEFFTRFPCSLFSLGNDGSSSEREWSSICAGAKSVDVSKVGITAARRDALSRRSISALSESQGAVAVWIKRASVPPCIIGDRCRYVVEHVIDHDGCGG